MAWSESMPNADEMELAKQHFFAGLSAYEARAYASAETRFKAALAIVPGRLSALVNLAVMLFHQEKLTEAISVPDAALAIDPNDTEALVALGSAEAKLGHLTRAAAAMERAVATAPGNPMALMGRASVHLKLRQYDLAIADYQSVRRIDPSRETLAGQMVTAKINACDWRDLDADIARLLEGIRNGTDLVEPFYLLAVESSPADQLQCATATVRRNYPQQPALWTGNRYEHNRIRVAYVSGDYRAHPLSRLMAGIFEHHDRSRFEITAVATAPDDGSEERRRIAAAPERFVDLGGRSNAEVAQWLSAAEIDVAIDLGGLTDNGRPAVFAMRPAPVQVSYLGFPGTSGAPFIDYLVADRTVIPPEMRRYYSEKIATLPDTYYPTDDSWPVALQPPSRAAAGLPADGFVFCCFNSSYKITPEIFAIWLRLLRAVPSSCLWLLGTNPDAEKHLRREAARQGVAPERIVFAPRASFTDHLARQQLADLALDTLPYNAHTTACDALWAGLPVITCPGATFPSRVAASLLGAMDLGELVTATLADYEALALALATDPRRLAALKAKVAAHRTTTRLFATAQRTRDLEAAYTTMVERQRAGETPADFAVAT